MNLVLSGPVSPNLRNAVVALSSPRNVVRQHSRSDRFEGVNDAPDVRVAVTALCDGDRVDHAYVEEGLRFSDFKLLAMDMDSTLITIECIDEIADFAGKKAEVAAITEATMQGAVEDFAESLRRRVGLLKGADASVLNRVFEERLEITPGGAQLIAACVRAEIYTLLVSGGFTFFAERLQSELKLSESYANVLEICKGLLTGRVIGPVVDGNAKRKKVQQIMESIDCGADQLLVIGDGANDIPMMELANHSISYHGKARVEKFARHAIRYGKLSTALDYFLNEDNRSPVHG